ncbi:ABC-type amino acid transport/signal transduction system [Eupransor demetentiae]|uniref:Periplasmic component/domain (HisJ) n=2 Tax=Eupransor demetentiae TaxID=3109584 RepID=A0ABM9N5X1_9LACO|nr:ABC-type amino acid transport/signal transduction system [Lactobacillaceae bacterium LMG 33000]
MLTLAVAAFSLGTFAQKADAASEPHYVITTDGTYPPFDFANQDNQYVGIDQDILKAIAKAEGFTYTLKPMSFNAATQSVSSDQADGVIAGMSITPERKAVFDFGTPYYRSGIAWAVAKGSKIKSLEDLRGKTVAIKTGTSGADYALSIQKKYGFKVTYFNDSETLYRDVINGNSVATFGDLPVLLYSIKNGTELKVMNAKNPYQAGEYGFAVKKGSNAALLAAFNRGFAKIKADGTYQKIIDKYLNASASEFTGNQNSTWNILKANRAAFLDGLKETIILTVIGIILAGLWGLILGVMGVSQWRLFRWISSTIIYTFRGLPMMVLAFFIYIGLPGVIGAKIPALIAGIVTLVLNEGAYIGAFVRGGFESVDYGQMEAARSLGLSHNKAMRKVIMPQGIKLVIPSFVNQLIITLKDTSILSAIGIVELTQTGTLIVSRNSQGFRVWALVAMVYLIVITVLTWFSNWIGKRTQA